MDNVFLQAFRSHTATGKDEAYAIAQLYKEIFDVAGAAMSLVDYHTQTILYVNQEMANLTGSSPEELIGKKKFYEFVHPNDRPQVLAHNQQRSLGKGNPPSSYRFTFIDSANAEKDVIVKAAMVPGSTITIVALTNLTETNALEQKLKESEEKFRQLFEYAQEGIYHSSYDGKILLANPAFIKMLGYSSFEEVRELDLAKDIYVDKEIRNVLLPQVLNNGIMTNQEFEWRKKDRSIMTVRSNGRVIRDENGEFLCFETTVTDITQLKAIQAKLEASTTYFKNIIRCLPDPTFAINMEGRVVAWNKAMEEFTGVPADEILGQGDYAYAIPLHGERRPILIDYVLTPHLIPGNQYTYMRKEGETLVAEAYGPKLRNGEGAYVWGSASLIRNSEGKPIGAINIIKDFTEYKETQQQLKYLNMHDVLTGLYNRSYFEEEMRRLNCMRHTPISVIMCDVDGLKLINDSLGHHKGDELLKAAANAIRSSFRASDAVSRIGGDEFVVILPDTDQAAAEEAISRIMKAVDEYNSANPTFPLSLSTGFATGEPPLQNLFIDADNHLNRNKLHRSSSARSHFTATLMAMLAERDYITEGHAERLEIMAGTIADALELSSRDKSDLILLAKFHDIGKIGISDKILFKPDALTSTEMEEMKRHSEIGYRIAQSSPKLSHISKYILHHHEWWDGNGYPFGLKGEEIPLLCRILSIIDTYDAMTSDRPYREAAPCKDAVNYISRSSGKQFDPNLTQVFIKLLDENTCFPTQNNTA